MAETGNNKRISQLTRMPDSDIDKILPGGTEDAGKWWFGIDYRDDSSTTEDQGTKRIPTSRVALLDASGRLPQPMRAPTAYWILTGSLGDTRLSEPVPISGQYDWALDISSDDTSSKLGNMYIGNANISLGYTRLVLDTNTLYSIQFSVSIYPLETPLPETTQLQFQVAGATSSTVFPIGQVTLDDSASYQQNFTISGQFYTGDETTYKLYGRTEMPDGDISSYRMKVVSFSIMQL